MTGISIHPTPQRPRMTLDEFNALPDDPALDRMLIRGRIWEKPRLLHTHLHGMTEARIVHRLMQWVETRTPALGVVLSGEGGCDLPELETGIGIDVALYSAELMAAQKPEAPFVVGPPILAIEILDRGDFQEEIRAKIEVYLDADVKLVWIVDPSFKTVTVYSPDDHPRMFSGDETISGDPHLPGFSLPVSRLFQI